VSPVSWLEAIEWLWNWSASRRKRFRILIVEDNPLDADLLRECLRYYGLTAVVAHTAEGAQDLLTTNGYKLFFVDMRLTLMEGWDLVPKLWRLSADSLIVLTPTEPSDILKIGPFKGLVTIMEKPATVELVGRALRQAGLKVKVP
jgi:CheY-like chemotaxis protein